jgi:HAD superfamily hydrolase (TIGR01490 family)
MGRLAAIFDVDGTLLKGGSERRFFLYLCRRRRLRARRLARFFLGLLRHPEARFRDKSYLQGLPAWEIAALARCCYREVLAPRLRPRALEAWRYHQAQGQVMVILTGTLACLARPLADELGADFLLATELRVQDGCFTAALAGPHPRELNKALLLQRLAAREGLDLTQSYAYADHPADIPLLQLVGRPVVVNPTPPLHRLARRCGWGITWF